MPTTPPTGTPPPEAPNRDLPEGFAAKMDAFLAWMVGFYAYIVASLANVFANAVDAYNSAAAAASSQTAAAGSASAAASSAAAAANSAGAAMWAAGSYNTGQAARAPSNQRVYIARTTGSKPTDPALDPTNWRLASAGGLPDVPYSGTTATVALGERSRFTNAAAVAVTVPVPTLANEEWEGEWENGRVDNSFNIGAATLRRNGVSDSGVITNSQRMIVRLISVGANEWRFKQ